MKINKIEIKGFRGIKNTILLDLNGKSCLIYGENGSGKSSITDAIEWFYKGKVDHLSGEEIDKKGGITALRNINIPDNEISFVNLHFSESSFNGRKEINSKLERKILNNTEESKKYIEDSQKESLILRYSDLTDFILSTKSGRLERIFQIIGFQDVLKIKEVLKKTVNELPKRIKMKNFDNEISNREGEILEKLGERITDDASLVNKINELIEPLGLSRISSIQEIDTLIERFKQVDDSHLIRKSDYIERTKNSIKSIEEKMKELYRLYEKYTLSYNEFLKTNEFLKQIFLEKLWQTGFDIIKKRLWEEDKCPLCFGDKDKNELSQELEEKLKKISEIKNKKQQLDNIKNEIKSYLNSLKSHVASIQESEYSASEEFNSLKGFVNTIDSWIENFRKEVEKDLIKSEHLTELQDIRLSNEFFTETISFCENKYNELQSQLKGSKIREIHLNITLSWERYKEIKQYKKEKEVLERYYETMKLIYNEFIKRLKEELERFVNMFSTKLNEYYTYMHPGENISNIQVKIIEEEDALKGITIEYNFHNKFTSPPKKYLSESHLHSLGIALFLTSVEAFNKKNKFFILDDIISSFDTEHRKRLIDLLLEKFADYQIIMLTHEKEWFDLVKHSVRGKGWYINVIKWSSENGSFLDPSYIELKNIIEEKIKGSEDIGLGNLIRQYLEKILKEICEAIEVKMPYRSNETNEKRMCGEMLSHLKGELNKQPSKNIFEKSIDQFLNNSLFVANKGSHYDTFQPRLGDFKSFWDDVKNFEILFFCGKCNHVISLEYYENVEKVIRCKCGEKKYEWKR